MKTKMLVLFVVLLGVNGLSQNYELTDLTQKALKNSPISNSNSVNAEIAKLSNEAISKNYLPQIQLQGQASYQSHVTSFPITLPNFEVPAIPKDQYRANLNINQIIYDGGATKSKQALTKNQLAIQNAQIETNLFTVKEMVAELYFQVIWLKQNLDLLSVVEKEIENKITFLNAALKNGIISNVDLNQILAEQLRLKQQQAEIENALITTVENLSILVGEPLFPTGIFNLPSQQNYASPDFSSRPEFLSFSASESLINQKALNYSLQNKPKLSAFAQVGVGRPGLNMLDPDLSAFYIVGARLQWNLWDWNQNNKLKEATEMEKKLIASQKDQLTMNLNIKDKTLRNKIATLEQISQTDTELIKINQQILDIYSSKLENGTASSSEFITATNNLEKAFQNKLLHQIEIAKNQYALTLLYNK